MTLTFRSQTPQTSSDSLTGAVGAVPIAVSEVEVVGGPEVRYDADDVSQLRCGSGPEVTVGGESYETAVRVSARQVVESSVVHATLCERPVLRTDEVPVTVEASFSWIPLGLVLARSDGTLGEVDEIDAVDDTGAVVPAGTIGPRPGPRVVDVDADAPSTLVLAVPAGKGWTAVVDGRELPSLTVDGWAQGWTVPEGASRVAVRYASGEVLRWTAGAALSCWVLVIALALWSSAGSRRRRVPGRWGRRDQAMVGRSTQA
jgi:arabinofuranan 3-O-arabinosyltransferase